MGKQIKHRKMTEVIRDVLLDAARTDTWLSIEELAALTNYHESSLSTTISRLRREGTYRMQKRNRDVQLENRGTVWEYHLEKRA